MILPASVASKVTSSPGFRQAFSRTDFGKSSPFRPTFPFDFDVKEAKILTDIINSVSKSGIKLYVSDLTPLECFLKAFRIAEKSRSEEGKKSARIGFIATSRDSSLNVVSHLDESIINEAALIRESHKDPFDCFIFATAKVLKGRLLTEDRSAKEYLPKNTVSSEYLRKML